MDSDMLKRIEQGKTVFQAVGDYTEKLISSLRVAELAGNLGTNVDISFKMATGKEIDSMTSLLKGAVANFDMVIKQHVLMPEFSETLKKQREIINNYLLFYKKSFASYSQYIKDNVESEKANAFITEGMTVLKECIAWCDAFTE